MVDGDQVMERLARVEAENARLRELVERLSASPVATPSAGGMRRRVSRRTLLRGAGARLGATTLGAVAAVGATLGSGVAGVRAGAGDDGETVTVGGDFPDARTRTLIRNTTNDQAVLVLQHQSTGDALVGAAASGVGVSGSALSGTGVSAGSVSGTALVVSSEQARGADVFAREIAVRAQSEEAHAVFANVFGTTSGIRGESTVGTGVFGFSGPFSPARSAPKRVGVTGESTTGRGGWFEGQAAAIRLMPSAAGSPPATGLRGDLFVDSTGRLWYNRGGSTWVRLDA